MNEIWKDVPGLEGKYQVSNLGRVKGLARDIKKVSKNGVHSTQHLPERIIRWTLWKDGYAHVDFGTNGHHFVHHLVLKAFVGPRPNGSCTRHLDGNKVNNHVDNLVWGTYTENNRDKIIHGTITRGSRVNTSKLTADQVVQIRRIMSEPLPPGRKRRKRGSLASLAKQFGVSTEALLAIHHKKNWGHLG